MTERILITGGAGFIGFHLAKSLEEDGYEICLVDNYARGARDPSLQHLLKQKRVQFIEADLLDHEQTLQLGSNFSLIFHLAAIIGVRHVLRQPYEVLTHNTKMLDNVIDLARRQTTLSRLFFASTSEVYAGALKYFSLEIPTPETSPLALSSLESPRTSYMLSKIMGEAMLHQSHLPFTIFRPHNIYGPRMGMAHVIPEQLRNAFKAEDGSTIPVQSPTHKRSFCYVDDAVEMLKQIAQESKTNGETLNLGVESPEVTIRQLVQTCGEVVGKRLVLEDLKDMEGSPARRAPKMNRLSGLIEFRAKVPLREGIERTWEWYRDQVFLTSDISAE